jgi:hypothetical protein
VSAACLHPGRPRNARCDGCPFTDHAAPTPELAARVTEREPSLRDAAGAHHHPCDDGCLFAPEAQRAS